MELLFRVQIEVVGCRTMQVGQDYKRTSNIRIGFRAVRMNLRNRYGCVLFSFGQCSPLYAVIRALTSSICK